MILDKTYNYGDLLRFLQYTFSADQFVSVHASSIYSNTFLYVNQPSFVPLRIEDFSSGPKDLDYVPDTSRFFAFTVFEHLGSTYFIGLNLEENINIIIDKLNVEVIIS